MHHDPQNASITVNIHISFLKLIMLTTDGHIND